MKETLLVRNTAMAPEDVARFASPFNRALQSGAARHYWDAATVRGAGLLDAMVGTNAQIVAYEDDFLAMVPAGLPILLIRRPARAAAAALHAAVE